MERYDESALVARAVGRAGGSANREGLLRRDGTSSGQELAAMQLKNIRSLSVEGCKTVAGTDIFMELEQVEPRTMFIVGNDFSQARQAIRWAGGGEHCFFESGNRSLEQQE